ncbi:MAG TPA: zinc ribbon domain-containing protein [Gemmatimonadales bacterium]
MTCPTCGATATGKFCHNCGAALGARVCAKCGAALSGGARFCHACGAPAAGVGGATAARTGGGIPWFLVGGAVVVLLVIVAVVQLTPGAPPPAPGAPAAPASGPVDLSQLTPREAADRLFDRVMISREAGKLDTAAFFAPMALRAYAMLDEVDADARFHIGLLEIAAGDPTGAEAQADTLAQAVPTHLYASMLRADAARARGDTAAAERADQAFLRNYEAETAANRPEYAPHAPWLATYREGIGR